MTLMPDRNKILLGVLTVLGIALHAQSPVGTISGTVTEMSGAVIPHAPITITHRATGTVRNMTTESSGLYVAVELPPGNYEVRVSTQGFQTTVRDALVVAGSSTTANFALTKGAATDVVTVEAAVPQVNYEGKDVVAGTVNRETTAAIPLNGRSSMQTTSLEPGVAVAAAGTGVSNSLFTVTLPGGGGTGTNGATRYMVDGGVINDENDGSGASMNFSQEIVQATQVSSLSFDPSMGIGAGGAVNTVTRSGSNGVHGDLFFFYRDHNIAAYSGLIRSTIDPHPFFQRKDPGGWIGGPIKKNKLFYFGSYEHLQQTSVINDQNDLPSLQAMNTINQSPLHYNWITGRIDYNLSAKTVMFLRYTHDGSLNETQGTGGLAANQSGWTLTSNWSDQYAFGVVSTLKPNVVNDARAYFHYWQNKEPVLPQSYCQSAVSCIGYGDPGIVSMLGSGTFTDEAGNNGNGPQEHQMRSYQVSDTVTWVKGKHQIRFGMDFESARSDYRPYDKCFPACISLYSAETTLALGSSFPAGAFSNIPTSINSTAALNSLPIYALPSSGSSAGVGVGNGTWPGTYEPGVGGTNNRIQPWIGDTWKVTTSLTLNFGLEYNLETGLFPHNMPVPQYLAPILEGQTGGQAYGVGKGQPLNKKDFAPLLGFAWALGKDKKTVIRGGGGMYWDTLPSWWQMGSQAAVGPAGDGRVQLSASAFTNIFPNMYYQTSSGVQPLPIGAPLPLNSLSTITLADFIQIINQQTPAIQAQLNAYGNITKGPYSVSGVQVAKQGVEIFPENFPFMHSFQTSIGVQRELPWGMVLSADWVRRQGEHVSQGELDLNRFGRVADGLQSVIPQCPTTPNFNPNAECSTGAITFWTDNGRSVYDGLLVKVQKRLTNHFQFVASYALQKTLYTNASQDLNNYFATYGPTLAKQNLNIAGTVNLPWGFRVTLNSSIISAAPAEPNISGIDLNGAGNTTFELALAVPNLQYNCFNYSCGQAQLASAVAAFNSTYAGTKALNGVTVPKLTLPSHYQLGAPIIDQDMRLTKEFVFHERYHLQVFGEVFNVLNIGNLTYGNLTLNSASFGQPTGRVGQASTFSSGGPRAEQVGARVTF
jgi:hypothetical protein